MISVIVSVHADRYYFKSVKYKSCVLALPPVSTEFPQVNLSNSSYPDCHSQAWMTLFCPCEEAQLIRVLFVCGFMCVFCYML